MTDNAATLKLGVDATGMKEGDVALDRIGDKAEKAETRTEAATKKIGQHLGGVSSAATKAAGAVDIQSQAFSDMEATAAPTVAVLRKYEAAQANVAVATTGSSNASRVFSQQLSQVFQQGAVTGNYLGALAIQLPDIAGGMAMSGSAAMAAKVSFLGVEASLSTLIPVVSIIAMIAIPLVQSAFSSGKSAAERLAEAVGDAESAVSAMDAAAKEAVQPMADLAAKYGAAATEAQKFLDVIADAKVLAAMDAVQAQITATANTIGLLYATNKGNPFGFATSAAADLGLAVEQAHALQSAIDAVKKADGLESKAAAAANLNAILMQTYGSLSAMPPQMRDLAEGTASAAEQALRVKMALDGAGNPAGAPALVLYATQHAKKLAEAEAHAEALRGTIGKTVEVAAKMQDPLERAADAITRMLGIDASGSWLSMAMSRIDTLAAKAWAAARAVAAAAMQEISDGAAQGYGGRPEGLSGAAGNSDARGAVIRARLQITAKAAADAEKAIGGASGKAAELTTELSAADKAAQSFAESMSGKVTDAIEGSVDWMVGGFKDGFKGLIDGWADTLRQMIGMAIKSKLTQYLFGGGTAMAGTAAAAATGQGGGVASGLLGTWGASGMGSGFLGGMQASVSGGLGGLFSVGSNAAAAGVNGIATLGSTLGAVVAPIAAIAAAFSFLKTKTTQLDSGLQVTIAGMDAFSQTFSTVEKTKFWGLSKNTGTTYSGADSATSAAISAAADQVQNAVMASAKSLGVAATAFDNFYFGLSVSTKGMTQDQAIAALQAKFAEMGDAMAMLIPGLQFFVKTGEGAAAALSRLATAAQSVDGMADTLGLTFRTLNLYGANLASSLVDQFGGLDAMAQASSAYYQAFYTDAERTWILTRQTSAAMAALGYAMPTTRDGFRALVQAQDLTTEAGQKTFAGLLNLAGSIGSLFDTADAASTASAAKAAEAAQAQADAAEKAAKAQADAAADAADALQKMADATAQVRESISSYIADLTGAASELVSPATALAMSQATYRDALASVASGDTEGVSKLTQAADALLSNTRNTAGSALDVARAQAMVIAQLNGVGGGGLIPATGGATIAQIVSGAPITAKATSTDGVFTALLAEIQGLRGLMANIGAETITFTKRTSESLQKWDKDGMPAVRT